MRFKNSKKRGGNGIVRVENKNGVKMTNDFLDDHSTYWYKQRFQELTSTPISSGHSNQSYKKKLKKYWMKQIHNGLQKSLKRKLRKLRKTREKREMESF